MKKFEISSRDLFTKCDKLIRVLNAKNTLAILENFLFKVEEGKLSITAADGENYAVTHLDVTGTEDSGSFMLTARTFLSALKEIPEQPITVTLDGKVCTIKYTNGHFCLPEMDQIEEFPMCPAFDYNCCRLSLSGESLGRIFSRVSPFVAQDELRPIMNGICFAFKDGSLDAVASDGHGLARLTERCSSDGQGEGRFVLSHKSARLAEAFLGKDEAEVSIGFNASHSHFRLASFELYSRLVEGNYPNYNSVIPVDYTDYIEFARMDMLSAVRRTVVFSNSASLLLKFQIGDMLVDVTGQDIDFSTMAESSFAAEKSGRNIAIGLKGTLVQRALGSFSAERVRMYYKDQSRSVLYNQADEDGNWQLTVIVMPMMLPE